ncbi:MAG TPA: LEA type 2 family protein [Bacteroidales bacterium]|nr:LEA type 2 family protein [Bacteroidales bacterium]
MTAKSILKSLIPAFILIFFLPSCAVLDQTSEMKTFTRCMFRLSDIQDVLLAGVDVQDVQGMNDLSFSEASKLSMAALSGKMPLGFTLNVEVMNPNEKQASMNELFWELFIDDIEITQGKVSKKISIPPGGTAIMPVGIQVDLFKVLTGESANAVMNFGMNLTGSGGQPSRVKLKIKPSVYIGMTQIKYPGFFTIEEEFTTM